jgi:hypothetical protein
MLTLFAQFVDFSLNDRADWFGRHRQTLGDGYDKPVFE